MCLSQCAVDIKLSSPSVAHAVQMLQFISCHVSLRMFDKSVNASTSVLVGSAMQPGHGCPSLLVIFAKQTRLRASTTIVTPATATALALTTPHPRLVIRVVANPALPGLMMRDLDLVDAHVSRISGRCKNTYTVQASDFEHGPSDRIGMRSTFQLSTSRCFLMHLYCGLQGLAASVFVIQSLVAQRRM